MWPFTSRSRRPRSARPSYRPRLESLEDRCLLSGPGSLDTTFGTGGDVTTPFKGITSSEADSVAIQTDGKIVVAGAGDTGPAFELARYNSNGTLDSTFGTGGMVTTTLNPSGVSYDPPYYMVLQPDGKIVVGASNQSSSSRNTYELARYNTNGKLDTTFGPNHNGTLLTSFPSGLNILLRGLAIETVNGSPKLVAGVGWGRSGTPAPLQGFALARYNLDGSLDSTFGTGGEVVDQDTTFFRAVAKCMTAQADSKILVGGEGELTNGGTYQLVVARFNTSGNLDSSFGSGGYAIISPGTAGEADAIAVQPDGKIVAGGPYTAEGLVRLNTDGSLDSTFGAGGIVSGYSIGDNGRPSLAIQTNGKIVAGGNGSVYRFNPNGSLDTAFGTAGVATMPNDTQDVAIALQTDGKIVAGGAAPNKNYGTRFEVARFLGDPIPVIGSFTANPNPITSGSTTTLTVSSITDSNAGSSITQVTFFYFDSTGTKQQLGTATQTSPGVWTLNYTVSLAAGTYTIYAQAEDNYGLFSNPFALTLTVQ